MLFKRGFQWKVNTNNFISNSVLFLFLCLWFFKFLLKTPMYCGKSKWKTKRRNKDMVVFCGIIWICGTNWVCLAYSWGCNVVDMSVFSFSKKIYSFKIFNIRECKVVVRGTSTKTIKYSTAMNYNDSTGIAGLSVNYYKSSTFLLFNISDDFWATVYST